MPTLTFWSANEKAIGQTVSASLAATVMAIEHNYKVLLMSVDFNDETISITSCYTKDISIREYGGCSAGGFIGHTKGSTATINTCFYDESYLAIGGSYTSGNITTNTFEALSDSNFGEAIRKMNANLTDCDYIFGEDGLFVKRQ